MSAVEKVYEIILIGDSGNVKRQQKDDLLELLKAHLPIEKESAVIFLGDNIYPKGMPSEDDILRKDAEQVLNRHYDALTGFKGKVIFIPGNHDWNKGKKDGLQYILRQEKYISDLFQDRAVFIPNQGCPGPKEISVHPQITVIAIDTQWWMQSGEKPLGKSFGCEVESEEAFFEKLSQLLENSKDKRIIVLGHHPIYSYSLHGGKYKWRHHVFPLTLYKKKAYLPLPFFGSLIPMYRKYVGAREDIAHPKYRYLRERLKKIFRAHPGLIYISGHEHNLQYIEKYNNHYLISGSASKSTYVLDGKYSKFSISKKGFLKLHVFSNGTIKIEALITNSYNPDGELAYQSWIV